MASLNISHRIIAVYFKVIQLVNEIRNNMIYLLKANCRTNCKWQSL